MAIPVLSITINIYANYTLWKESTLSPNKEKITSEKVLTLFKDLEVY